MARNTKPLTSAAGKLGLVAVLGAGIGTSVGSAIGNVALGVAVGTSLALLIGGIVELWRWQQSRH